MTTTRPFTTTSGDYLSVLLSLWLPLYGWALILPILICAALGLFYDDRFLPITIMLPFIVMPMLMSFFFTHYMLTPEARRAVIRKQVKIDEGKSLRLIYLHPEDEHAPQAQLPLPDPETIAWADIIAVKSTSRFRVYLLKGPRLTFLLIPWSALHPVTATDPTTTQN